MSKASRVSEGNLPERKKGFIGGRPAAEYGNYEKRVR